MLDPISLSLVREIALRSGSVLKIKCAQEDGNPGKTICF